jgi:hypothetical protein
VIAAISCGVTASARPAVLCYDGPMGVRETVLAAANIPHVD